MSGRILAALILTLGGCGTAGGAKPHAVATPAARPAPASKARKVVVLRLQVGEDGVVRNVEVVRSAGSRFDKAAARAASRARFEPPLEDGRPIESSVIMTYRFRADEPQ